MEHGHPLGLRAADILHDGGVVDVLANMVISAAAISAFESSAKQHSIHVRTEGRGERLVVDSGLRPYS